MFNLFGKKKADKGFYLQLDENGNNPAAQAESKPVADQTESKPVAVKEKATAPVAPSEKQPKEKSSQKKSVKKKSVKTKQAVKTNTVSSVAAQPQQPPAKIREPIPSDPDIKNFSTDYLVVPSKGRRRPGPSLKGFKEMASQVKVPRR